MRTDGSQLGFTDYASMVWKRRSTALLAAGLFCCATFIAFNFVPRKYASTCVFERRANTISTRTGGLGANRLPESFGSLRPLLTHHLTGPEAVQQALEDLGYTDSLPRDAHGDLTPDGRVALSRIVESIRGDLHTSWIISEANLDRIALRLTSRDPIMAQAIPNQLVANYIAATQENLIAQLASTATYVRQQIEHAQVELDELQAQRYNFLRAHPDMMPGNPQHLTLRIDRTTDAIDDIRQRREAVQSRLTLLKSFEGDVGTKVNPDHAATVELIQDLRTQLEHHRTVNRMTDRHPKIIALQQRMAEATAELEALPVRIESTASPTPQTSSAAMLQIEDIRAELNRLESMEAKHVEALDRYAKAQANFLPVASAYQQLSVRIGEVETEQRNWQQNLNAVEMALAAERSGTRTNLEIVRAAPPVHRPTWPALWHVFGLAIGGGLAFGISLAIVMARLGRCFESAEEARNDLGLPVLGVVGPILSPAARRLRAIRRYVLAPTAVAALLLITTLAAAGVVIAINYPGRYARITEHLAPTTQAMWHSVRNLLGLM